MTAEQTFDLGDLIYLTAAFTNPLSGDAPIDPTTVSLSVRTPAGVVTTYTYAGATITKDSTGNYSKSVSASAAGRWYARWFSAGTGQAAEEASYLVRDAQAQ